MLRRQAAWQNTKLFDTAYSRLQARYGGAHTKAVEGRTTTLRLCCAVQRPNARTKTEAPDFSLLYRANNTIINRKKFDGRAYIWG